MKKLSSDSDFEKATRKNTLCMFVIICLVFVGIGIKLCELSVIANHQKYLEDYPLFFIFAKYVVTPLLLVMLLFHVILTRISYSKYSIGGIKILSDLDSITAILLIFLIGLSIGRTEVIWLNGLILCTAMVSTGVSAVFNFKYLVTGGYED